MPLFSLPYLIFLFFYILLTIVDLNSQENSRRRQIIRIVCITGFIFFIGLRGFIGTDWYSYYYLFEQTPTLFDGIWSTIADRPYLEPGFQLYVSFLKTISSNYHFFVFAGALLDVAILNIFFKRYVPYYALGFLVFFIFEGIGLSDIMRNVKSIMLFLLSIPYLQNRKPVPFFLLNIAGLLFHASSILYLPLYFFIRKVWSRKVLIIVFIFGNILFLSHLEIAKPVIHMLTGLLGGKYAVLAENYLEGEMSEIARGISIGYLERTLTCLLIIAYYHKLLALNRNNGIFINFYTLYFISYFWFSDLAIVATRFALLFIFSYWVLWPALYQVIAVKFNKRCFLAFVFIFALLKINGITNNPVWQYDNVLSGTQSYAERARTFEQYSNEVNLQ